MKHRQYGNTILGLVIGVVLGIGAALGVAVYVTKVPIPFLNKTQPGGAQQDEAEMRKNRDWDPNAALASRSSTRAAPAPVSANGGGNGSITAPIGGVSNAASTAPVSGVPGFAAVPADARVAGASTAAAVPASGVADPIGDLLRGRTPNPRSVQPAVVAQAPSTTTASVPAAAADPFVYFIQAGAFRSSGDADSQRAKLALMGIDAAVSEREQAGRAVFRVRAGPFNSKDDADRLKGRLDRGGIESALVRVQR
ncbi:MAG: SPOR domain-containing protein [Variovorax sp.]